MDLPGQTDKYPYRGDTHDVSDGTRDKEMDLH